MTEQMVDDNLDRADVKTLHEIESDTLSVVQSLIPYYNYDDAASERKSKYIAFRASGFTHREACKLIPIQSRTVSVWLGTDLEFKHIIIEELARIKEELSKKLIGADFIRNYRLILMKDYKVIKKSIVAPDKLTTQENHYLLKARSHYSPQQLSILQSLLNPDADDGSGLPQDFAGFVTSIRRTQIEEVRISA